LLKILLVSRLLNQLEKLIELLIFDKEDCICQHDSLNEVLILVWIFDSYH
jgi:hypothetical protein